MCGLQRMLPVVQRSIWVLANQIPCLSFAVETEMLVNKRTESLPPLFSTRVQGHVPVRHLEILDIGFVCLCLFLVIITEKNRISLASNGQGPGILLNIPMTHRATPHSKQWTDTKCQQPSSARAEIPCCHVKWEPVKTTSRSNTWGQIRVCCGF